MLMPTMLLGLLGISIPVLIHLLHRQQTKPVQWGAMQFLRTSPLRMKQRKKVEHWLLMAVRMLAIAVLAFLLARPRLPRGLMSHRSLSDAPIDVAVVIDHSLSTGRLADGKSVFTRAVDVTNKLLDQLAANDTLSVVLAEHRARPLNAQPIKKGDSGGISDLKDQLALQPPGLTDCSMPDSIAAARHLLAGGRNQTKLIVILSDQQRNNWHIHDQSLWRAAVGNRLADQATNPATAMAGELTIHSFPIAPDAELKDASVSSLQIRPAILGVNRPVQITAEITNTGTQALAGMNARMLINGTKVDSKPVTPLSPRSAATIRFDLDAGFSQAGSNTVQVAIDADDALAADDQAVAVANVLQHIPVLIVDGQFTDAGTFKSSQFLQAAMQPADPSLIQAKIVSVSQARLENFDSYAVTVLNDLPSVPTALAEKLVDYTRSGHGMWIILGPRTLRSTIEKDLATAGLFTADLRQPIDSTEAPSALEQKDSNNPVLQILNSNDRNALTGAAVRKWWSLTPVDATSILSATSGDPIVMERAVGSSGGLIDIWTTGVDGSWNNLNLMPNFVPLVNETIAHLSTAAMHGLENRGLDAGEPIEWAGVTRAPLTAAKITLPDGSTVTRAPVFNNGRWLLNYPDTFLPGVYKLQFTPAEVQPIYFGVNIDRNELDPTSLSSDDIKWLANNDFLDPAQPTISEADLTTVLTRNQQTPEIWGWLGALLLMFLLFETFVTYRLIAAQKRINTADAAKSTGERRPQQLVSVW
jgi:hypothetical protein